MTEFQSVINEVRKVVNGKDRAIVTVMLAILANGNILLEDIPGVGKTTMALAFSKALGLDFIELKATKEGYPLYKKLGFEEQHSPYTPMKFNLSNQT
jgi:MoxR-like ATPase